MELAIHTRRSFAEVKYPNLLQLPSISDSKMDQYWSASEAVLVAILTSTTLHVDQYCSRRRPVLITFMLLYRAL